MPNASDGQSLGPWSITDLAEYCVGTLTRQAEHRVRQSEPLVAEEISGVVRAPWQPARRRKWLPGNSELPPGPAGFTPTLHWRPPSAGGSVSPGAGVVSR